MRGFAPGASRPTQTRRDPVAPSERHRLLDRHAHALRGRRLGDRPGRPGRAGRPQRRRQDDALEDRARRDLARARYPRHVEGDALRLSPPGSRREVRGHGARPRAGRAPPPDRDARGAGLALPGRSRRSSRTTRRWNGCWTARASCSTTWSSTTSTRWSPRRAACSRGSASRRPTRTGRSPSSRSGPIPSRPSPLCIHLSGSEVRQGRTSALELADELRRGVSTSINKLVPASVSFEGRHRQRERRGRRPRLVAAADHVEGTTPRAGRLPAPGARAAGGWGRNS